MFINVNFITYLLPSLINIAGDIPTRNKYLTVYGVLGLLQAIFVMMATSCVMIGTLIAATKLHSR